MNNLHPYAWRTRLRRKLPFVLLSLGIADKKADCVGMGAEHDWHNKDDVSSGCYHCKVVRQGRLWEQQAQCRQPRNVALDGRQAGPGLAAHYFALDRTARPIAGVRRVA